MLRHALHVVQAHLRERQKVRDRSPQWEHVRDAFLASQPICAACGQTQRLQVHHVQPFHLHPELELVDSNLIVLCMGKEECHLRLGHGDSFKSFCPNVRELARRYRVADKLTRKALVEAAVRERRS